MHQGKRLTRLPVVEKINVFSLETAIYFPKHAKLLVKETVELNRLQL